MAAIHKSEGAMLESQKHVYMNSARNRAIEPNQLAVQSKMKHHHAAIELQDEIFPAPLNAKNSRASQISFDKGRSLWPDCNPVNYFARANRSPGHKRTQGPRDCFHLWRFGHFP
jgi:hypothetical protein